MKIIFFISMIYIVGCTSLKERAPSSLTDRQNLGFELVNDESLLKTDYVFELLNLYDLNNGQLKFTTQSISLSESKKAVSVWVAQLQSFNSLIKTDRQIKMGATNATLKSTDLIRLERALDFIGKSDEPSDVVLRKQVEIITAFNENFKKNQFADTSTLPFEFSKNNSGRKFTPAASSFWSTPRPNKRRIPASVEAYSIQKMQDKCLYDNSSGTENFRLQCGGQKFDLQLTGEAKAAAMNSFLYARLGYNVTPVHYVTELPIAYDRNLVVAPNFFKMKGFAQLKNGEKINFANLRSHLIPYCNNADIGCSGSASLFDTAFENNVDFITLQGVALSEASSDHVFGPWSYESLDHTSRGEIRALLLVGAFTGNNNLQKENNQLVWSSHNFEVKHLINNVASGYGRVRPGSPFDLNNMHWDVAHEKNGGNQKSTVVIDGYQPTVKHSVFSKIWLEEAQWITRLIAGISEDELTEGLAESGFSAAELLLTREKLVSIQKNLVEVLSLTSEFPALASRKINRNLNYSLQGQNQIFNLSNGSSISVAENDYSLKKGVLKNKP